MGCNTQLIYERTEVRISHLVENNKAGINSIGIIFPANIDGVRMTANIVIDLKNREVVVPVQEISANQA